MGQFLKVAVIIVGLWSYVVAQVSSDAFRQLYDSHNWFELRDAVQGKRVPALYLGAIASAFNRVDDAERYLNQAIREGSTIEAANEAREGLINVYMRLGRFSEAIRVVDDALKTAPSRSDLRNVRGLLDSFTRYPNQTVHARRRLTFPCAANARGIFVPLSVNGKAVNWFLDTAFSMSGLNEAEARMLGLSVLSGNGKTEDLAGGTTTARTAVAERVVIGGTELRNVPLLVFPDSQPPWNDLAPGKRGVVGLPVALALQAIRWTTNGTCQVGPVANRRANSGFDLLFDGSTLLTRVQFEGRQLDFVLDTGNQAGTQLWARFARDFPTLMSERGRKGTKQLNEIGGSSEHDVVVLPEIRLRLGGFETVLRPATVFSKPVGNDIQHGLLGMDLLSQGSNVTIDFSSMRLTLR